MGAGASISNNKIEQTPQINEEEFKKIRESLSSLCEPLLLNRIALALLDDDDDDSDKIINAKDDGQKRKTGKNECGKEAELKQLLHQLANSVHQQKNEVHLRG